MSEEIENTKVFLILKYPERRILKTKKKKIISKNMSAYKKRIEFKSLHQNFTKTKVNQASLGALKLLAIHSSQQSV